MNKIQIPVNVVSLAAACVTASAFSSKVTQFPRNTWGFCNYGLGYVLSSVSSYVLFFQALSCICKYLRGWGSMNIAPQAIIPKMNIQILILRLYLISTSCHRRTCWRSSGLGYVLFCRSRSVCQKPSETLKHRILLCVTTTSPHWKP